MLLTVCPALHFSVYRFGYFQITIIEKIMNDKELRKRIEEQVSLEKRAHQHVEDLILKDSISQDVFQKVVSILLYTLQVLFLIFPLQVASFCCFLNTNSINLFSGCSNAADFSFLMLPATFEIVCPYLKLIAGVMVCFLL